MTETPSGSSANLPARASAFTAEDFARLGSEGGNAFDDAMALVNEKLGGEVIDSADLGDGFGVLDTKNKGQLIGVTFFILSAQFSQGDNGEFVSCRIVTKDGRKLILNDGGTGIYEQLKTLWTVKPAAYGQPVLVRKGLRESRYNHPEHGPSVTYYLDTSASEN